jgi:hypothetical protein
MSAGLANTIEFKVGKVEIRCSGESGWVSEQVQEVLRSLREMAPDSFGSAAAPKPESVAELLARSRVKTFGEQAGVIAFWLQEFGGRSRWRSGEIV